MTGLRKIINSLLFSYTSGNNKTNESIVNGSGHIDTRAGSIGSSIDEGGFNEPSPEIKAKLKPVYQFEINSPPLPPSPPARSTSVVTSCETYNSLPRVPPPPVPSRIQEESAEEDEEVAVDEADTHFDLNYASLSHAVAPTTGPVANAGVEPRVIEDNQKVLYATIKPEIPPPTELMEADVLGEAKILDTDKSRESSFIPLMEDDTELPVESSLLDLKDVEYADASESSEVVAPDAMTADEAECLLSSR